MTVQEDVRGRLRALVRDVPDFPRPGIVFRDITGILRDASAFADAVDAMAAPFAGEAITAVAGIESRGFILGAAVALRLDTGFVPVRKEGRLPAERIAAAYELEYGSAVLEVHSDAMRPGDRVLIVDDLLATGGTAAATASLIERLGAEVAGFAFLIELGRLRGAERIGAHRHVALLTL